MFEFSGRINIVIFLQLSLYFSKFSIRLIYSILLHTAVRLTEAIAFK